VHPTGTTALAAAGTPPPAPAVPARRRSWSDPWLLVIGALAAVTYCLIGFEGTLRRDIGLYVYGGQQVLAGDPPYVGVLNRAGPLAHLLPALGIAAGRLVGADDLTATRVLFMLLAVASVMLAYALARDVFGSRVAGLAAGVGLLACEGFSLLAAWGPREKTPMVSFMLAALLAAAHRRWLTAGVLVALATLTLQIALFALLPAMLVAMACAGAGGRIRALARFVGGGLLTVGLALAGFAAAGALRDLLDGFLLLNATNAEAPSPALTRRGEVWNRLVAGFGWSMLVVLGGLVALWVAALARLAGAAGRRDAATAMVVAGAVGGLSAVAWSAVDFDNWPDAFLVLPFSVLGVGVVASAIQRRLPISLSAVVLACCLAAAVAATVRFAAEGGDPAERHGLREQRASVTAVLEVVPEAEIWSLEGPQALVLSGRRNPTRHQMMGPGLVEHLDETWSGGFSGFIEWNLGRRPALVAMSVRLSSTPVFRAILDRDYVKVGGTRGWRWFASRSLGARTLDELRAAAAGARLGAG
jgi:hypothetical protein